MSMSSRLHVAFVDARALAAMLMVLAGSAGCRNSVRALPESPTASAAMGAVAGDCCWATAVNDDALPNCFKVSDALYRGAQPTNDGLAQLPTMGIMTVVNVCLDDTDQQCIQNLPLAYKHWPMSAFTVGDDEVVRFLRLVNDKSHTPVFLHCHHGADRTGVLCAMYRVVVQGWTKDDAIIEMTRGGMRFNSLFGNLVRYVRNADVEGLRRRAGIVPPSALELATAAPLPAGKVGPTAATDQATEALTSHN
jgi:protein tyrosine phosphatase (PTP) superfamily phosphohydrolase (DUF442 family)